ncbi:MAG: DUF3526 domain-containing protein [Bacteroidota bacterium]
MVRFAQIKLIAKHTYKRILNTSINHWLIGVFLVLTAVALSTSFLTNSQHQHEIEHYGEDVRARWENNPDKHPHRMAHYGYVAFRSKTALSFFDRGLDSYLGNVIFLEAHRQNSVNFSNASQSSGLLRFGELSAGLLLQLLLPLLIFFWGFASVSDEREKGISKLYLTQGVAWKEVILGKSLGVFSVSMLITLPILFLTLVFLLVSPQSNALAYSLYPLVLMSLSYLVYTLIMSMLSVWVSARSASSKSALIQLIGFWLFFVLIVPKLSQVTAQILYPSPSKIAFDMMVEDELIQQGDSHNPDDPHFNAIRDSLLQAYKVSSVKDLPFNYSGFIMKEGEKLSTDIYRKYQSDLIRTYLQQNGVVNAMAMLNPYLAIKNISMTLSGSDFDSYQIFKAETEEYRYKLAQTMNDLQIKYISNTTTSSADKGAVISQQYWKDFPMFEHRFLTKKEMTQSIAYSTLALLVWLLALALGILFLTKNIKAF